MEKHKKYFAKAINLDNQFQRGIRNFNYLTDHFSYETLKVTLIYT